MEALYYTAAAVVLYLVSDWILQRVEIHFGRRFEHRTVIFFFILLGLAVLTFALIRRFLTA